MKPLKALKNKKVKSLPIIILTFWSLFPIVSKAQTTINLDEHCDCEIIRHTSEVSAGDTSPAGINEGDMLIDPSGDLFFWNGDSWETTGNDGDWIVNGNTMYNANSGNVGIGTSTPEHGFHVDKGINGDYSMKIQNNGGGGYGLWIRANAGSADPILHLTDNLDRSRFMVLGNGKAGIGTSEPANTLDIRGSGFASFAGNGLGSLPELSIYAPYSVDTYRGIGFTHGTDGVAYAKIASRHNGGGSYLSFGTSNSYASGVTNQAMVIDPNGRVGIGTATPTQALSVNGDALVGHTNRVGSATNTDDGITLDNGGFVWTSRASGNGAYFAQLLGTTGNLHVFMVNSATVGSISTNGSSTSYNTTSDYRLKKNISPLKGALEEISKLKPATYQFKSNPETTEAGFIAHELQKIYPQAVTGTKDEMDEEGKPKYQNVDYGKLTPLLAAGIQELKALIAKQENLLEQQQTQIGALKAELEEIQADNVALVSRVMQLSNVIEKEVVREDTSKKLNLAASKK